MKCIKCPIVFAENYILEGTQLNVAQSISVRGKQITQLGRNHILLEKM